MLVTLNLAWIGHGASLSKWRGWALEITPDGEMTPIATGLRSPAGYGYDLNGELFYAENQGDWVGSGGITHLERGDFAGNPAGLIWTDEPESPLRLKPEDIPDTGEPEFVVAQRVPGMKSPAVWFPHVELGISTSDILVDSTAGGFGPFAPGFRVVGVGNADSATYPTTQILDFGSHPNTTRYLAQVMGIPPLNISYSSRPATGHDVLVILGNDWQIATPTP